MSLLEVYNLGDAVQVVAHRCTTPNCRGARSGFQYRAGVCSDCQQPLVEA